MIIFRETLGELSEYPLKIRKSTNFTVQVKIMSIGMNNYQLVVGNGAFQIQMIGGKPSIMLFMFLLYFYCWTSLDAFEVCFKSFVT